MIKKHLMSYKQKMKDTSTSTMIGIGNGSIDFLLRQFALENLETVCKLSHNFYIHLNILYTLGKIERRSVLQLSVLVNSYQH